MNSEQIRDYTYLGFAGLYRVEIHWLKHMTDDLYLVENATELYLN
jgi:hypothetical protein